MTHDALELAARHPHDFTIQYPPRREFFKDLYRGPADLAVAGHFDKLLLYVHVPFCAAKCHYCNFAVDLRPHAALHTRYVDGLLRQLDALGDLVRDDCEIAGIDIGGGTPTLLATSELQRLLAAISPWRARSRHPWPLSIETTPAIAASCPDRLAALHAGGVQRVSLGVQSTDESFLRLVNRGAQRDAETRALVNLRAAGFARISVDLIFGLPGQTDEQWRRDLERVADAGPDAITTYDCLYRGKGRALTRRQNTLPGPDRYGELYDLAYALLLGRGYHARYGSLNFSRRADETGTSAYFEGRLLDGLPYLGLGNYASSLLGDQWLFAPHGVDAWLAALGRGELFPVGDAYRLPLAERAAKYLLLSLSFGLLDGRRCRAALGVDLEQIAGPALREAEARGWLIRQVGDLWTIAPGSFRELHRLRALFYTPEALRWLGAHARSALPILPIPPVMASA